MGLLDSWFDDLLGNGPQQQPAASVAGPAGPQQQSAMPPQVGAPSAPIPAPQPDAVTAFAQYQKNQNTDVPWWRKASGLIGGAMQDYAAARAGHPERATGMSDFMGGLRQRQAAQLGGAAQNQLFGELSSADPSKPLPSDILLKIAKFGGLNGDITPFKNYLSMRASTQKEEPHFGEAPQFTADGRAYVLGNDGSVKWLDGVKAPGTPNQPFNQDGTPNPSYQAYQLKLKGTGVPRAPKTAKPDPSNLFENPGKY